MKKLSESERQTAAENLRIPEVLARVIPPPPGMDFDEWRSEVFLAFLDAVRRHDPARGALRTLADRIVKRRRLALVIRSRYRTHGGDRKHLPFNEEVHTPTAETPRFQRNEIDRAVRLLHALHRPTRQAIELRCQGKTFGQIGARVGVSESCAWRLVQRGTKELRELAAGRAAR
jgi:DNA-directed RNA polymerase specialized sigma24 family protein